MFDCAKSTCFRRDSANQSRDRGTVYRKRRCVLMRKVAIVGDGGHGKVIRELINARSDTRLAAVLDDKFRTFEAGKECYTGPPEAVAELRRLIPDVLFLIAIGNNSVRKQLAERLGLKKEDFITLIHPSAIVSKSAVIGKGP